MSGFQTKFNCWWVDTRHAWFLFEIRCFPSRVQLKVIKKFSVLQDLDIFSTTKKQSTPHLPYRPPTVSGSTPGSVNSSPLVNGAKARSKPNDFGKNLAASLKEAANKMEAERPKSKTEFAKPGKIPERRGSNDSRDSKDGKKSRHESKESVKSRRSSVEAKEKPKEASKEKSKDVVVKDKPKEGMGKDQRSKERQKEAERQKEKDRHREKSKSRRESEDEKEKMSKNLIISRVMTVLGQYHQT